MRCITLFVLAAALMLPAPAAYATLITFVAHLMHVDVTFSGSEANTTASHIHCCLPPSPFDPINIGVATTTPTFPGFPLGVAPRIPM